jgi:hypothetical protein
MVHSVSLEEGLPTFPTLKSGNSSIENSVISLFPDEPGIQHEYLHEERLVKLTLGFLHHLMKREIEVPRYAQMIPTLPTEGAGEE